MPLAWLSLTQWKTLSRNFGRRSDAQAHMTPGQNSTSETLD